MKVINKVTGDTVYEVVANHSMTLDEVLDLMAPDDWREQVNKDGCGYFEDLGEEIYYDDLDIEA